MSNKLIISLFFLLTLNTTSQPVHKHRRNLAAKAAQMAEQEAERYFIAGLAARQAQSTRN